MLPVPPSDCDNCGDSFKGAGRLCPDCVPMKAFVPPSRRAVCRSCKEAVDWNSVRRLTRVIDNASVECMYYCGSCGGVLEFAAWAHTP